MEEPIKQLFIDFIANRCSPAEIEQVHKILQQGLYETEWREAMESAEPVAVTTDYSGIAIDEIQLLKRIQRSAGISKPFTKRFAWIAYAAILLLILSLGLFFITSSTKTLTPAVALAGRSLSTPLPTAQSKHKWIKLPDGSSVQLNSDTELDFPQTFAGSATREVTLRGEAYFDIKHDAAHPFIIHTGKIKTTVLGTAFNISAYTANTDVTITVTRGKVMVANEQQTLAILSPDQQLVWKSNAAPLKAAVNAETIIAWKKNDMIMDDITLADAAKMITARYGLEVNFANDKVKNCRFTAAFLNRNDIEQVINVLQAITGSNITLKDGTITINGEGC